MDGIRKITNACVLLSGGIDSIALAYHLKPEMAISVNYGQKAAESEIQASRMICDHLGIEHKIIVADCSSIGAGLMSNDKSQNLDNNNCVSAEWWPYRNQLVVTLAAAQLIRTSINNLIIGTVLSDSYHRDSTVEFVEIMNALLKYQEGGIELHAPAILMRTEELVEESKIPLNILLWSHSCYVGNEPCGECSGCLKYINVINNMMRNVEG